ncbi:MAG: peptide chain release factor 3 [Candidatus Competibacteraceae bacterium]|nr:peptide chain release factor 3 [Candidatus Competibacteraceae bacterium]
MTVTTDTLEAEIARRRTFAIISHPDAGKTTMTEKMLLYGGAIHMAGAVRAKKSGRHATSDWMSIEKERGISVSTSVMQFPYDDYLYNLLDTPGHEDFSEDTYRTLTAADCAIMLIDAAKGVEAQTRKLFEVCRLRAMPIFTFINKMDREGREALDLMSEIEDLLGIHCVAQNWPIGMGAAFRGVYERDTDQIYLFERGTDHGSRKTIAHATGKNDDALVRLLGESGSRAFKEDLELLDMAGESFDRQRFLDGEVTPVFFGSALTNFGVEPFLRAFGKMAPQPGPRPTNLGQREPTEQKFAGFIFKIQANMDKKHRDRIAFLRVCSGKFERGMTVKLQRNGKDIKLNSAITFFAQERNVAEEGYPGDIIGLYDTGNFAIADTLTEGEALEFEGIPRFSPEVFSRILAPNPMKRKRLDKGLQQLSDEGTVQVLYPPDGYVSPEPVLAAVGQLQFEVVQQRMNEEYDVEIRMEQLPYSVARWLDMPAGYDYSKFRHPGISDVFRDHKDRLLVVFRDEWTLQYAVRNNPEVTFRGRRRRDRKRKLFVVSGSFFELEASTNGNIANSAENHQAVTAADKSNHEQEPRTTRH